MSLMTYIFFLKETFSMYWQRDNPFHHFRNKYLYITVRFQQRPHLDCTVSLPKTVYLLRTLCLSAQQMQILQHWWLRWLVNRFHKYIIMTALKELMQDRTACTKCNWILNWHAWSNNGDFSKEVDSSCLKINLCYLDVLYRYFMAKAIQFLELVKQRTGM